VVLDTTLFTQPVPFVRRRDVDRFSYLSNQCFTVIEDSDFNSVLVAGFHPVTVYIH
jgi:hypothetical protein